MNNNKWINNKCKKQNSRNISNIGIFEIDFNKTHDTRKKTFGQDDLRKQKKRRTKSVLQLKPDVYTDKGSAKLSFLWLLPREENGGKAARHRRRSKKDTPISSTASATVPLTDSTACGRGGGAQVGKQLGEQEDADGGSTTVKSKAKKLHVQDECGFRQPHWQPLTINDVTKHRLKALNIKQ